jgi:hypothetical protein
MGLGVGYTIKVPALKRWAIVTAQLKQAKFFEFPLISKRDALEKKV